MIRLRCGTFSSNSAALIVDALLIISQATTHLRWDLPCSPTDSAHNLAGARAAPFLSGWCWSCSGWDSRYSQTQPMRGFVFVPQLARVSKEYYPAIHDANLYADLKRLMPVGGSCHICYGTCSNLLRPTSAAGVAQNK